MKTDGGFKESEKLLNELEEKIHREYAQAKKEMGEKVDAYFAKFEKENAKMEQAVRQGRMSAKEYNEWRMRKMATGKQYIAMRNTLAKDLTNTDKIAMKMVNQSLPDVYALNMNYGTYSIEKDSRINTSFTLYNHAAVERLIKDNPQLLPSPKVDVPKDLRWNQQHIQSAITQGILQGKSIPKIAKDLQRVVGMDENAAIRNARTAMTGAQNAGRLDSMKRAAARGIGVKKGWLSTLDNVTRDSHVDLDGEVQEIDKTFSNGLMYPGDASGAPAEVYNCRCRLTHEYDKYKTDWSNPANRNTEKLGDVSYQQWKDRHKGKASKNAPKIVPKTSPTAKEQASKKELSEEYKAYIDKNVNPYYNIEYRECEVLAEKLSESEIIERIAGGDMTEGSCASLSYAYIANKYCDLDVIDFRGGDSRKLFSSNSLQITRLLNKDVEMEFVSKEARDVAKVIKDIEANKEYRLVTGRHAAMIRKTENGLEYLELQSPRENGWKPFEYTKEYTFLGKEYKEKHTIADTLYERFGCRKTTMGHYYLEDAEKFKGNADFENLMGYINTAPDKQKKGKSGYER